MRYESVVWDWNGTLLDDVALAIGVVNEILHEQGLDLLTRQRYLEIFDFPVQLYYERAGMDFSEVPFAAVSERFCRVFEEQIDNAGLFQEVEAVLAKVSEFGVRQFVLSSTEHDALVRMMTGLGVAGTFDAIHGLPDGLARGKTDVGRILVESYDIDPERSVLIGDTKHDWEVAETLGMDCVLIATGHQSFERLATIGCPVLESLREVTAYLIER